MRLTLLLIFNMLFSLSQAQNHSITTEYGLGKTLSIYPKFPENTKAQVITITYNKEDDTLSTSSQLWGLPKTGFTLSFFDFGNPSVLGQGVGLQYQFGKQLINTNRNSLFFTTKYGGVFFNKPFHYIHNTENIITGSHLAFFVSIHLQYSYVISKKLKANASFNICHSSNAHSALPNVGYNIPILSAGLSYTFNENTVSFNKKESKEIQRKKRDSFVKPKHWTKQAKVSIGVNEFGGTVHPVNGPKYNFYVFAFSLLKRVNYNGSFQVGLEGYYSEEQRIYLESEPHISPPSTFLNASAAMAFIGYEFYYKHFGLNIQGGFYFHNPFDRWVAKYNDFQQTSEILKTRIPGKMGVKYYLKDKYSNAKTNFFTGIHVKSSLGQADFLEISTGVQF